MLKPKELKLSYKKVIGFTEQQHKTLIKLESYHINVNDFIRDAVKEKIEREHKIITKPKRPF